MAPEEEKLPADKVCTTIIASLLYQAYSLGLSDLENVCRLSLQRNSSVHAAAVLSQHEVLTQSNGKGTPGTITIGTDHTQNVNAKWKTLEPQEAINSSHYKNHVLRFVEDDKVREEKLSALVTNNHSDADNSKRRKSVFDRVTGIFRGGNNNSSITQGDYEETTSLPILRAPITDICVISKNENPPLGYYRIGKTPYGRQANMNIGSGGNMLFLCIKKDVSNDAVSPICNLLVIFPDRGDYLPPGYSLARRGKHPCNFNSGTSGEGIYLAIKREKGGNFLTDIQCILPGSSEVTPPGFMLIDCSPTGQPANLNSGTGGSRVYLCYKQRRFSLRSLECKGEDPSTGPSIAKVTHFPAPKSPGSPPSTNRNRTTTEDLENMLSPNVSPHAAGNRIRTDTLDSLNSETEHTNNNGSQSEAQSQFSSSISIHSVDVDMLRDENHDLEGEYSSSSDDDDDVSFGTIAKDTASYAEHVRRSSSKALSLDKLQLETDDQNKPRPVSTADGSLRSRDICLSMYAVLVGLQVRYSTVSHTSMQGILLLLNDTSMFASDVTSRANQETLTLLHIVLEAICERLEYCIEIELGMLLYLIYSIVKFSKGNLQATTIQRVIKALSFSILCEAAGKQSGGSRYVDSAAGDTPTLGISGKIPFDIGPKMVMQELLRTTFRRMEQLSNSNPTCSIDMLDSILHNLPPDQGDDGMGGDDRYYSISEEASLLDNGDGDAFSESTAVATEIVLELITNVLDAVELARITDVAQKIVSKPSSTVTTATYWAQISVIGKRIFLDHYMRSCFFLLCSLVKMSWSAVRYNEDEEPLRRDLGVKLATLESLHEYLSMAGELQRSSKLMGFEVRRLVVPCILANIPLALREHRVFSRLLALISVLWNKWRVHTHIEFAILVEQLIIPVMQASSPKQIQPIYQMIVVQEVVVWFDQPTMLVEMFVNYDMDRSSMSHWNVFSHIVRTLCTTARKIGHGEDNNSGAADGANCDSSKISTYADTDSSNPGDVVDAIAFSVTTRSVYVQALEEACRIAKALMDATGHAFLILQDSALRSRSLQGGAGWQEDSDDGSGDERVDTSTKVTGSNDGLSENAEARADSGVDSKKSKASDGRVKKQRALHQEKETMLDEAIKLYHKKGKSIAKAVGYLIEHGFMVDTPQEIVHFLRIYRNHFDPAAIGDFLGEGGHTEQEIDYWGQIRFRYTRAISFHDMDVEPALRLYLTGSGFRLPGEAQKVDRFVEVFVKTFWQDNSGTERCPFRHPDTVHLLTYAIIMLNTDHHRANVEKKNASRKMSAEQFKRNLRGVDMGNDIDPTLLASIFHNVESNAIAIAYDDSASKIPLKNNSRSSSILGSIAHSFVPGSNFGASGSSSGLDEHEESISEGRSKFRANVEKSLLDSSDLLRSLSPYVYHFYQTGIDTNISMDLVSFMYETVWFHFRAVSSALLVKPHSDMTVTFQALDMLCYSLTAAIFLDVKSQKMMLADQLMRFQIKFCSEETKSNSSISAEWFDAVRDCAPEDAMEVISRLHKIMFVIKDRCQESSNREKTIEAATKFDKKNRVLEENAYFVREADIGKRNRNGNVNMYRFFLFSDQLIYARKSSGLFQEEYKVHGQLSLRQMSVSEIDTTTDPTQRMLYIEHPYKSFMVIFNSPLLKNEWLRDIQQTISSCERRADMAKSVEADAKSPSSGGGDDIQIGMKFRNHKAKITEAKFLSIDLVRDSIDSNAKMGSRLSGSHPMSPTANLESNSARLKEALTNTLSPSSLSPAMSAQHSNIISHNQGNAHLLNVLDTNGDIGEKCSDYHTDSDESVELSSMGYSRTESASNDSDVNAYSSTSSDDSDDDSGNDGGDACFPLTALRMRLENFEDNRLSMDLARDPDYSAL